MKFIYSNGKSGIDLIEKFKDFEKYQISNEKNENGICCVITCIEKENTIKIWCKDENKLETLMHYIEVADNDVCFLPNLLKNTDEYKVIDEF